MVRSSERGTIKGTVPRIDAVPDRLPPRGSSNLNRVLIQLAVEGHPQLTDRSFVERLIAGEETSRQTEIDKLHGNFPSESC